MTLETLYIVTRTIEKAEIKISAAHKEAFFHIKDTVLYGLTLKECINIEQELEGKIVTQFAIKKLKKAIADLEQVI